MEHWIRLTCSSRKMQLSEWFWLPAVSYTHLERYELSMERIRAMKEETAVSAPFYDYFQKTADFILEADRLASDIRDGRQARMTLEELQKQNRRLYEDIAGEAYENSYASPCLLYTSHPV